MAFKYRGAALLFFYSWLFPVVTGGIPFVSSIRGAASYVYDKINCRNSECCTDKWISLDYEGLKRTLEEKVYGQHLVKETILKYLKAHAEESPRKALVLSLHGSVGTGENYVSQIVAEKMFVKGMKSKYVHLISAMKDFPHHGHTQLYKQKLKEFIESRVAECPRSFFIIDEMDKMPPGIIDTLKPYLEFHDNLEGVDYKKAVFFFLSNTAADDITKRTLTYWDYGKDRGKIPLKEMEEVIRLQALHEKNAPWNSELINAALISAYIPFLPLEKRHVKQCIKDALVQRGFYSSKERIPYDVIQDIADELTYFPKEWHIFSTTGCKLVDAKITYIMYTIKDEL